MRLALWLVTRRDSASLVKVANRLAKGLEFKTSYMGGPSTLRRSRRKATAEKA